MADRKNTREASSFTISYSLINSLLNFIKLNPQPMEFSFFAFNLILVKLIILCLVPAELLIHKSLVFDVECLFLQN